MYAYVLLDISKLRSLEILDLGGNGLSNNNISSINGPPPLRSLGLSSNNLEGSLDISGEYCYGSCCCYWHYLWLDIILTKQDI